VAESKAPAQHTEREAQIKFALGREQRELEKITQYLEKVSKPPPCEDCERLIAEVIAAIRRTRAALSQQSRAAICGLIDDIGFLSGGEHIDAAFRIRQEARSAYLEHRRQAHPGRSETRPQADRSA
jgi:hypothetical protein